MNKTKIEELERLLANGDADEIPDGWLTRQEYQKMVRKSICTTDRMLVDLVNRGLAKRKMFKRKTNAGVRPVPHFYIIKK